MFYHSCTVALCCLLLHASLTSTAAAIEDTSVVTLVPNAITRLSHSSSAGDWHHQQIFALTQLSPSHHYELRVSYLGTVSHPPPPHSPTVTARLSGD